MLNKSRKLYGIKTLTLTLTINNNKIIHILIHIKIVIKTQPLNS